MEKNEHIQSSKEKIRKKLSKKVKKDPYISNYEAALKITYKQKMESIKESNKRLEEYPETAQYIKEFINSLIVEKVDLKKYFNKEEFKIFKKLNINLRKTKKHTIFEMQSLEKDILRYYSNPKLLPKGLEKKELEKILEPISKIINYEKEKLKTK